MPVHVPGSSGHDQSAKPDDKSLKLVTQLYHPSGEAKKGGQLEGGGSGVQRKFGQVEARRTCDIDTCSSYQGGMCCLSHPFKNVSVSVCCLSIHR